MGPSFGLDEGGKSLPTGIRSPDRPARSESLYRLSYRGPHYQRRRHNFSGCVKPLTDRHCVTSRKTGVITSNLEEVNDLGLFLDKLGCNNEFIAM